MGKKQKDVLRKMHAYKSKQHSIKKELERFRKLIENEKNEKMNQIKQQLKNEKKFEKIKRRTLIVKLEQSKCNKMYTRTEIESIFKIYGRIAEIDLIQSIMGAQIIFTKSKYVERALDDAHTLNDEFFLVLVDENNQRRNQQQSKEQQWRQFVNKQRANMNYLEYQEFVRQKVETFIEQNRVITTEKMDVDDQKPM